MRGLMAKVIAHLFCLFLVLFSLSLSSPQESQQMLGRLIPEKQLLNDQLKQVQQNSLHSRCIFLCMYTLVSKSHDVAIHRVLCNILVCFKMCFEKCCFLWHKILRVRKYLFHNMFKNRRFSSYYQKSLRSQGASPSTASRPARWSRKRNQI